MDGAGLFVSETQAEEKSMIIGCWDIKQPDASIKGRYHSYQIPVVTKNEVGQKDSSGWVFVWDRGDRWLFSICSFCVKNLFPFPLAPA